MDGQTYWYKQTAGHPLYPDLLWSRPENRMLAGKLLVIGGNAYGFAAPAEAYQMALQSGIGVARVLLPDATKRLVGSVLEAGDFAPSTPSGSFSQKALDDFLSHAAWADGVLLAGDFGRNSETAIVLEKFMEKYPGFLTMTKDATDYFIATPAPVLQRPETALVVSFAQLQKLASSAKFPQVFTFSMDMLRLVETLHEFTRTYHIHVVVKHLRHIFVASGGYVSTTVLNDDVDIWRVRAAARSSVWWLQNPGKSFEALTTAVYETTDPGQSKVAGSGQQGDGQEPTMPPGE